MIITRILVDRLNSDPSKSVKLQFKFLLETNSSLIGQFLNWYMIYMLNKVHKYLKKSSTNFFCWRFPQIVLVRTVGLYSAKEEVKGLWFTETALNMYLFICLKWWLLTDKVQELQAVFHNLPPKTLFVERLSSIWLGSNLDFVIEQKLVLLKGVP